MILEYTVIEKDNGLSINEIIKREFGLSTRLFNKLLKNNLILLNDVPVDTRKKASLNDKIIIDLNYNETSDNIVPIKMDLDIIYEDECMLVLNKPAHMPVHPSLNHYEDSLSNGVRYYFDLINLHKKIRPVNRLDLDTSGIVIFAKNEYVQENFIRQMANNTFSKEYLAIVVGTLDEKSGVLDYKIDRKLPSIIERHVSDEGQTSITKYKVLKEKNDLSLVRCTLLTGRTHQIRVHFAYINHPVLGDTLYGNPSNLIDRQALHSYKVSFNHPISSELLTFECLPSFMDLMN